jgi:diguanylate cyclase
MKSVGLSPNVAAPLSSRTSPVKTFLGRPWILTILLASGLCVAYLIGVLVNWGSAADRSLYANLGMLPMGLAATFIAWKAGSSQNDLRSCWAWRLISLGFAGFFVGDALFFVYQNLLGQTPFPSLADAGYLAYYPLMFTGLLLFPHTLRRRLERVRFYLDAFIVFLGGGMVISYFFLIPTLSSAGDGVLPYSLSAGYPVGDLLLLVGVAYLLLRNPGHRSRMSFFLLAAGLLVGLFADVVYGWQSIHGTFRAGGVPDAGYMLSWSLFAWGGYLEFAWGSARDQGKTSRAPRWAGTILPYGFASLGLLLLIFALREPGAKKTVFGLAAAVLSATVIARQLLTYVESRRRSAFRSLDQKPDATP